MKGNFVTALTALVLCLSTGAALATTTLPAVVVRGTSIDQYSLACTGYDCASFLESIGGISTSYRTPVAGMGDGGARGLVGLTRAQFCNQLASQKPSGCNPASPPSVPIYDPMWEANGCGTGAMANFFLGLVMDSLYADHYSGNLDRPVHTSNGQNISFLGACNKHDECWGSGGARGTCDMAFRVAMEGQCNGLTGPDSSACFGIASTYFGAVSSDAATEHYDESVSNHSCAAWAYDMRRNGCT